MPFRSAKEALYFKALDATRVQCLLCPHQCRIKEGRAGFCGVRAVEGGTLVARNFNRVASLALDPVEKKPLYHFHPGEFILSVGTVGCNLSCLFCQNWGIAKDVAASTEPMTPRELVDRAGQMGSFGIAYTYNEPFVWFEFVLEAAKLAKKEGLKNVLVTNGYVSPEPLLEVLPFIDAANIDIKSIRDEFYEKTCAGRVGPVLATVRTMVQACHVELTNLIIPTLNDSEKDLADLVDWIARDCGDSVPLHFSRYFPCYKMTLPPTPVSTLRLAESIAKKKLRYVYLGNV